MENPLQDWHAELLSFDSEKNHIETLEELEESFLESTQANDRQQRIKTCWLLRHLKKMF